MVSTLQSVFAYHIQGTCIFNHEDTVFDISNLKNGYKEAIVYNDIKIVMLVKVRMRT